MLVEITKIESKYLKNNTYYGYKRDNACAYSKYEIPLNKRFYNNAKKFIVKMNNDHSNASRLLKNGEKQKLKSLNKGIKRSLKFFGRSVFKKLVLIEPEKNNFEDLYGRGCSLELILDGHTRKIPWELAYDGKEFLGAKYAVGRILKKSCHDMYSESGLKPLNNKALVIGINYENDSKNRLYYCEKEAQKVADILEGLGYDIRLYLGNEAKAEAIKRELKKGISVFHFTGHGGYSISKSSRHQLIMADKEDLTEDEIFDCFIEGKRAPYLTFMNACQTATEIYDPYLIDAFVDHGCNHVIGSLWTINDFESASLATCFYKNLKKGNSIGASLLEAKKTLKKKRSDSYLETWSAMVHYGTPADHLPEF